MLDCTSIKQRRPQVATTLVGRTPEEVGPNVRTGLRIPETVPKPGEAMPVSDSIRGRLTGVNRPSDLV